MTTTPRIRSTSSTQRRADNMRTLIAMLRTAAMTRFDIELALKFSPSGARKYISAMRDAGVIEVAYFIDLKPDNKIATAVYRLTNDEAAANFLASLNAPVGERKAKTMTKKVSLSDPSRHLYLCLDDMGYLPKVTKDAPAARDSLVEALFGAARVAV